VIIQLSKPDGDGGEFDEAHEIGEELVISCCHAPELFELDEIALFIEINVIEALDFAVAFGRVSMTERNCTV
jgi:hypothetical protein